MTDRTPLDDDQLLRVLDNVKNGPPQAAALFCMAYLVMLAELEEDIAVTGFRSLVSHLAQVRPTDVADVLRFTRDALQIGIGKYGLEDERTATAPPYDDDLLKMRRIVERTAQLQGLEL